MDRVERCRSTNESFHRRHELFTRKAYETPGLLPDRYVFVLTNLCNLDCHFCYQDRKPRKDRMTTEDWIRLIEQLPDYARVTLTGGEPLVFSGFREVFRAASERLDVNMVSNGLLLKEEVIDLLLAAPRFRVLSISIDDVGNALRGVKPEKWKHAEEMMRCFRRRRDETRSACLLDAKTVVLDENAGDLLAIHRYCMEELGCDSHSFQFLKGSPIQHSDAMFPFERIFEPSSAAVYRRFDVIREQLERVREYNLSTRNTAFLHPKVGSLSSEDPLPPLDYLNIREHRPEQFEPCRFPWSSVHINVDGTLFPCLAVAMGNLKEETLREIIDGPEFERFRAAIRAQGSVPACNRCGWLRPRPELVQTQRVECESAR